MTASITQNQRKSKVKKSVLATLLLLSFYAHAAQKAYVTDRLEVQLRSGQSLQHKILKMLPSGTSLTVTETDAAAGYSHVVLDSGEDGWVLTRYLSAQPVARTQIDETVKKLDELTEENKALKAELTAFKSGKNSAEKASEDLNAETERLRSELISIRQASANALQIQAERDQLQEKVINLERELDTTKRERQALDVNNKQDWFLIGAGVLFGGILLGLFLPRLSWRKKSSWNSF